MADQRSDLMVDMRETISEAVKELGIEVVDLRDELPAFYARLGYRPAGEAPFGSPEKLRRPAKYLLFTKALAPSRD